MSLTANYFELFGLPVEFALDTQLLADRYRHLQRQVHPDNYANAPERDRRLALQMAAQVNTAFETLKDPLQRGRYILQLQGINTDEGTDTQLDSDFLMLQMELREELADIPHHNAPLTALQDLLNRITAQMQQQQDSLQQQLERSDYPAARNSVRQLQFFYKLRQEALNLEEELL